MTAGFDGLFNIGELSLSSEFNESVSSGDNDTALAGEDAAVFHLNTVITSAVVEEFDDGCLVENGAATRVENFAETANSFGHPSFDLSDAGLTVVGHDATLQDSGTVVPLAGVIASGDPTDLVSVFGMFKLIFSAKIKPVHTNFIAISKRNVNEPNDASNEDVEHFDGDNKVGITHQSLDFRFADAHDVFEDVCRVGANTWVNVDDLVGGTALHWLEVSDVRPEGGRDR